MNARSAISGAAATPALLALAQAAHSPFAANAIGSWRTPFVDYAIIGQLKADAALRLQIS